MARTKAKPADPNQEARDRAAARRNAKAKPPVEDKTPAAKEKPAKEKSAKEPVEIEMKGGGIVGAAEDENKVVEDAIATAKATPETTPETPEAQTQETAMGEGIEASDEQAAETEPPNEPPIEATGEPEAMGETEPEAPGMEPAPEAQAEMEGGPGEYQPPAGQSYDELLDAYHEALAYGDNEQARNLRDLIREHEYLQIKHRLLADAHNQQLQQKAMAEEQAFLATAQELAAAHPELGLDGLEADKVLALKDVYWQYGSTSEADALRQAVADLYPGEAAAPEAAIEMPPEAPAAAEMPMAEPAAEMPMAEAVPEPPVEAEAAPEASNVVELPDMTDRMANKRKIPSVPTASARTAAAPKEVAPSRSSAIQQMRAARGQV